MKISTRRTAATSPLVGSPACEEYHPFGGEFKVCNRSLRRRLISSITPAKRVYVYAAVLSVMTVTTLFAFMQAGFSSRAPVWATALLVGMAIIAEKQSVQIGPNTEMSVAALPILFAAVVYDPYVAMAVGGGSVLVDFRRPYARWVIWTSSRALTGAAAALAAAAVLESGSPFGRILAAVAVAAATEGLCDICLNSMTVAVRGSGSVRSTTWAMGRLLISAVPFYVPMVAVLAYAYDEVSPWAVVFFAVPALAAQSLLGLYQNQRALTERVVAANARLEGASLSFAGGLVAALDARDHYTAGHSATVAVYARDIAATLGLDDKEQRLAHLAGMLHDIGKVGLPPGILEKAGPLTIEERREMELHSVIGERILGTVDDFVEIARVVRHHHERHDGSGYPDGLRGQDIPLISRIVAVADAYGAMTSERSYRNALTAQVARERLVEGAGVQFDAGVVTAFVRMLVDSDGIEVRPARAADRPYGGHLQRAYLGVAAMPQ